MNKDDLEKKMELLSKPEFPGSQHRDRLKMAVIGSKRSAKTSLWLLLIPFMFLAGAALQSAFRLSVPPWSWLQHYGHFWPTWLRMTVFVVVLIVIPLIVVLINFLSIIWLQYDSKTGILHFSVKVKGLNMLLMIIGGLLAFLFIMHTISEWFIHLNH
jgi:hypothetical protein